jgi:hypothetical protein
LHFAFESAGEYSSKRYELITEIFGWTAGIFFVLSIIFGFITFNYTNDFLCEIKIVVIQICAFSFTTVIARDYEKIIKPYLDNKFNKK